MIWDNVAILGLPRPGYPLADIKKDAPPAGFTWLGATEEEAKEGIHLEVVLSCWLCMPQWSL